MKGVTVVDFLNKGNSHLEFNRFFIKGLLEEYDYIEFFGNKSHLKKLDIISTRVELKPVDKISKIWFFQLIAIFLKFAFTFKYKKIVILAQDNYFTPFLFLLTFFKFQNLEKIVFFHNNLDNLIYKKKRIIFTVYLKFYNPKILCLTEFSFRKAKKILNYNHIFFLPHPSYYNATYFKEKKLEFIFKSQHINVIVLGRQAIDFETKYAEVIEKLNFNNIVFHIFSVKKEIKIKTSENIYRYQYRPDPYLFNYLFKNADYAFFSSSSNKYRASGLLMDSFTRACPIIAPLNGHFLEFRNYKIGQFYNKTDDLIRTLKKIDAFQISRGHYDQECFKEINNKTSFENINKIFLNLLNSN